MLYYRRKSMITLTGCFIDANFRHGRKIGSLTWFMRIAIQNPPESGVMLFDNIGNGFYRHRLGRHHNERFKQQRKTASRTGSGGSLPFWLHNPRNSHEEDGLPDRCLVLGKVQMLPLVPLRIVCTAFLSVATGPGKHTAPGKDQSQCPDGVYPNQIYTTPHAMAMSNPMSTEIVPYFS